MRQTRGAPKEKPACAGRDDSFNAVELIHVDLLGTTQALSRPTPSSGMTSLSTISNLSDPSEECKSDAKNGRSQPATPVIFNRKSINLDFAITRVNTAQFQQSPAWHPSNTPRILRVPPPPRPQAETASIYRLILQLSRAVFYRDMPDNELRVGRWNRLTERLHAHPVNTHRLTRLFDCERLANHIPNHVRLRGAPCDRD